MKSLTTDKQKLRIILILLLPNIVFWILVYPGYFQADHQARIVEVAGGNILQWHSVLWQICAFPFLYLSPSYGIYGLIQIGLFVLCAAYSVLKMQKLKLVSRRGAIVLAAVFAFSPMYLMYNELYSSDMVYAFVLMPLTAKLIEVVRKRDCSLRDYAVLFALIVLASLLRKNAILIAVVVPALLLFMLKPYRKEILKCFGCAIVSLIAINAFFSYGLKAVPSPGQEMLSVPANQIARVYAEGGDVPPNAEAYLESIRSAERWAESYNPRSADNAKGGLSLTPEFFQSWLQVVAANPELCLDAYVQMMSPFWELTVPEDQRSANNPHYIDFGNYDNFTLDYRDVIRDAYLAQFVEPSYEGAPHPGMRGLISRIVNAVRTSNVPILSDIARLVWFNRGLPFYVCLVCLVVAIWKKQLPQYLVIAAPVICTLIGLLLFSPVALMRYAMEMYYALPFLILFFFRLSRKSDKAKT